MKPIYISATIQDSGKTCISLGLMHTLMQRGLKPGYMKPVGQHYLRYKDKNIDEDAVLFHQVFEMHDAPYNLSPIAIERGFTRKFIFNPNVEPLEKEILNCVKKLEDDHDFLIIEGTGHAGVGSCFNLSNARVAELLGAQAVIVTSGGIGKPLDEAALSMSLFKEHDVKVMGVILNKVLPEKYDKISETVAKGLENMGTRLLGAIPFVTSLTHFTVGQLAEAFNYEVLCGEDALSNRIESTVIAAMEPQHVLEHIHENTLIITPGDRIDNILVAIIILSRGESSGGLILTGGLNPHPKILPLLRSSRIPVLTSTQDTFTVSSRMKGLGFKICAYDTDKITNIYSLVDRHVDVDYILDQLKE